MEKEKNIIPAKIDPNLVWFLLDGTGISLGKKPWAKPTDFESNFQIHFEMDEEEAEAA